MPSSEPTRRLRTPDELFAHAIERGGRLRRRHRLVLGGAAATAVLLVAAAVPLALGDGAERVTNVATPGESTVPTVDEETAADATTTTTATTAAAGPGPTSTTTRAASTPPSTAPTTGCGHGKITGPNARGLVAFVRQQPDYESDIWTIDRDGRDLTRVTSAPGQDRFPAWANVGGLIVFHRGNRVYSINPDGTEETLVSPPSIVAEGKMDWHPYAPRLAVSSGGQIWTFTTRGTELRQVSNVAGYAMDPSWSPDGCRIVFSTMNSELWTVRWDGTDQHRLGSLTGASPDWGSSDRIAFQLDRQIALTDPDGGNVRVITTGSQVSARPSWSALSSSQRHELVFESFRDGNWEIYRIGEDGTGLTRLTIDPLPDNEPAW